jgi:hypothetical protein
MAVAGVGGVYALVLGAGMARSGFSQPIGDPILAIMEVLTVAAALPLVILVAAVHVVAPRNRRIWGILAICFIVMFATVTSAVHISELTVGRQLGERGLVWPSIPYALELLAWDFFLGLSLLCVGAALDPAQTSRSLRRLVLLTGSLCLLGLVGPVAANMRLQLIGVCGYAILLPVFAFQLARWFGTQERNSESL